MEDKKSKKRKIIVLITMVILLAILIADGILFYTSLKVDGIGRGFSRYWDSVD